MRERTILWLLSWWGLGNFVGCALFERGLEIVRDAPRAPGVLTAVNAVTGGVGGPVLEGLAAIAGLFVGGKVVQKTAPPTWRATKRAAGAVKRRFTKAKPEAAKAA